MKTWLPGYWTLWAGVPLVAGRPPKIVAARPLVWPSGRQSPPSRAQPRGRAPADQRFSRNWQPGAEPGYDAGGAQGTAPRRRRAVRVG